MPTRCLFVTDLHGRCDLYEKLFSEIRRRRPAALFLGGDLLPAPLMARPGEEPPPEDFVLDFLAARLAEVRGSLQQDYPAVFVILGNDDGRGEEERLQQLQRRGLWHYVHARSVAFRDFRVYGYAYVPPTPFHFKDWERYDVSRYVPPGCVSPEDGWHTRRQPQDEIRYATIASDLDELARDASMERAVFLFHTPPYETALDRAALDGRMVDAVPLDVHVGSIAVRRFIEHRQPLLTLHGHVHESTRLTGSWLDRIGRTFMFNAAHDGAELAVVDFTLEDPAQAERELI